MRPSSKPLAARLTARLDHMVPDPEMPKAVNEEAAQKLADISAFLANALPDNSLSPGERLERLARVVQDRSPDRSNLQPAVAKVAALENRLNELVPDHNLSTMEKLNVLVERLNQAVPNVEGSLVHKLESMGDGAAGIAPVR